MEDDEEVGIKEGEVSSTKKDENKMQSKKEDDTSPKVVLELFLSLKGT